jgi:hypothetical protein
MLNPVIESILDSSCGCFMGDEIFKADRNKIKVRENKIKM